MSHIMSIGTSLVFIPLMVFCHGPCNAYGEITPSLSIHNKPFYSFLSSLLMMKPGAAYLVFTTLITLCLGQSKTSGETTSLFSISSPAFTDCCLNGLIFFSNDTIYRPSCINTFASHDLWLGLQSSVAVLSSVSWVSSWEIIDNYNVLLKVPDEVVKHSYDLSNDWEVNQAIQLPMDSASERSTTIYPDIEVAYICQCGETTGAPKCKSKDYFQTAPTTDLQHISKSSMSTSHNMITTYTGGVHTVEVAVIDEKETKNSENDFLHFNYEKTGCQEGTSTISLGTSRSVVECGMLCIDRLEKSSTCFGMYHWNISGQCEVVVSQYSSKMASRLISDCLYWRLH